MNIMEYIKNNEKLREFDFWTVYLTIFELKKDGKIKEDV